MRLLALALLFPALVFADSLQDSDKALNLAYKDAHKLLGDNLKKSQLAWLKFRDLDCDAQLPNFGTGGFIADNHNKCITNHNTTRTEQLKAMTSI